MFLKSIRTETPEKSEKKDVGCVEYNIRLLRMMGCWPKLDDRSPRELLYRFYCFVLISYLVAFISIQSYGNIFVYSRHWNSISDALEDIFVFVSPAVALVKITTILRNKRRIERIINDLNVTWDKAYVETENEKKIIKKGVQNEKRLTLFFSWVCYAIAVAYVITSCTRMARNFDREKWAFVFTPEAAKNFNSGYLSVKFPTPITNTFEYLGSFSALFVITWVSVQGTISSDCVIWSLIDYHCHHFDILIEKIRSERAKDQEEQAKLRKKFVLHQLELLRSAGEVQSIFGPLLALQFTLTSIMICIGLFQSTQMKNMPVVLYVKNICYFIWKVSQLYVHCHYGQKLTDRTFEIQKAVYETPWYEQSISSRDNVFLIMRSQKPFQLAAAGIFQVSMATFMAIIQSSYSYFTLLRTFHQE